MRNAAEFWRCPSRCRATANGNAPGDKNPGGKICAGGGAGIGIAGAPGAGGTANQNAAGDTSPGGIPSITPAELTA